MQGMESAIVTGPTGAVGMALINNLISHGIRVAAVVRPGSARAARIRIIRCLRRWNADLMSLIS